MIKILKTPVFPFSNRLQSSCTVYQLGLSSIVTADVDQLTRPSRACGRRRMYTMSTANEGKCAKACEHTNVHKHFVHKHFVLKHYAHKRDNVHAQKRAPHSSWMPTADWKMEPSALLSVELQPLFDSPESLSKALSSSPAIQHKLCQSASRLEFLNKILSSFNWSWI